MKKLITDVDGVLTDGKFYYSEHGKYSKKFGPHDSDGIKILKKLGIEVIAISADKRGFSITKKRLSDMGVEIYNISEKERFDWYKENEIKNETIFIGDGLFDIKVLKYCKYSFSPNNAPDIVKKNAKYITKTNGSEGVLLEVALWVLKNKDIKQYKELTGEY